MGHRRLVYFDGKGGKVKKAGIKAEKIGMVRVER
jgi:hypothetical protein